MVAVAVMSLGLSLAGYYWDAWTDVPVAVRFITGVVAFGISPGLLIAGPLLARGSRRLELTDFVISVFTCSFSCNLLFNIALFAVDASFAELAYWYLIVQATGYALWAVWAWSRGRGPHPANTAAVMLQVPTTPAVVRATLIAAAILVVYIGYTNGSPPVNPEELVSLRKLAENPVVRYDNISFRDGEPSTYLFVPFQVLIVGTSVLAHLDVVLTYSMFWAVTTFLSIVVLTRLAYVMFGRPEVAAVTCLLGIAIAVFDARSVIEEAGILVPYPNRYGFGSGVLLPLGLLLFWSILREARGFSWRWALLIYLVVETTFVHARETLLAMGAMSVVFALLAARPRKHRVELVRIAIVLALMAGVLGVYKYVNLTLAPGLDAYVAELGQVSRDAAARMTAERGIWSALVTPAPRELQTGTGEATVSVGVADYRRLFVEPWQRTDAQYLGRLFLPLALLALPLYVLRSRSIAELSLAVLLAGLGLLTASGFLELHISALVGNPEIFVAYNVIFIAALFVFGDLACAIGARVAERCRRSPTATTAMLASAAALLVVSFVFARSIAEWRGTAASYWTNGFAWLLIVTTVVATAYRLVRHDLPLFRDSGPPSTPLAWVAACCIVAIVALPAMRESDVWQKNPFRPAYPSGHFTGDLVRDFVPLSDSHKIEPRAYPVDIVRFLRNGLPPNQTVLSADTHALSVVSPHFAAIVSDAGAVRPSYIANIEYLRRFGRGNTTFAVLPFLDDEEGRRLFDELVEQFGVDVVLVNPSESAEVGRRIELDGRLRERMQPVFEYDGFVIYRIRPARSAPTTSYTAHRPSS